MSRFTSYIQLVSIILFLLMSISCTNQTLVLDVDEKYKTTEFDIDAITHLTSSIEVSGNQGQFLDANSRIYPGDNFIVVCNTNSILKYSTDGRYVCDIARSGRGPGELGVIFDFDIDKDERFLYCIHSGNEKCIDVYDLISSRHVRTIPKAKTNLQNIRLINDSIILCFPIINVMEKESMIAYYQDFNGVIIDSLPVSVVNDGRPIIRNVSHVYPFRKGYLYNSVVLDTVYYIGMGFKIPVLNIKRNKKEFYNTSQLSFVTDSSFVFTYSKNILHNLGDGNVELLEDSVRNYYVDLKLGNISELKEVDFANLSFFRDAYIVDKSTNENLIDSVKIMEWEQR